MVVIVGVDNNDTSDSRVICNSMSINIIMTEVIQGRTCSSSSSMTVVVRNSITRRPHLDTISVPWDFVDGSTAVAAIRTAICHFTLIWRHSID